MVATDRCLRRCPASGDVDVDRVAVPSFPDDSSGTGIACEPGPWTSVGRRSHLFAPTIALFANCFLFWIFITQRFIRLGCEFRWAIYTQGPELGGACRIYLTVKEDQQMPIVCDLKVIQVDIVNFPDRTAPMTDKPKAIWETLKEESENG